MIAKTVANCRQRKISRRTVFGRQNGVSSVARAIYLPLANWGFVLMSLHMGTHHGAMLPKGKKKAAVLGCLSAVSLYGVYAFVKRQMPAYVALQ